MEREGGSQLIIRVLIAASFLLLFLWGAGGKHPGAEQHKQDSKHHGMRAAQR